MIDYFEKYIDQLLQQTDTSKLSEVQKMFLKEQLKKRMYEMLGMVAAQIFTFKIEEKKKEG